MQGRSLILALAPAGLMLAANAAHAIPSQGEVSQARANCHSQKMRVQAMEDRLGVEAPEIESARRSWESACAQAQSLMDLRAGRPVLRAEAPAGTRSAEFARYETATASGKQGCD